MEAAQPEVLDVARNWIIRGHMRDGEYMANAAFPVPGSTVHTIASAPDSNFTVDQLVSHLGDVVPCPVMTDESAEGFVHGDMAWVYAFPKIDVKRDGVIDLRYTVVLYRVDGDWKVVHSHLSEGVPHQP